MVFSVKTKFIPIYKNEFTMNTNNIRFVTILLLLFISFQVYQLFQYKKTSLRTQHNKNDDGSTFTQSPLPPSTPTTTPPPTPTPTPTPPPFKTLPTSSRSTALGTGKYAKVQIESLWSSLGILKQGTKLSITCDGFDTKEAFEYPIGAPSFFLNIWGGVDLKDRIVHFNPRVSRSALVFNHYTHQNDAWGVEKSLSLPELWNTNGLDMKDLKAVTGKKFVLIIELMQDSWMFFLNGLPITNRVKVDGSWKTLPFKFPRNRLLDDRGFPKEGGFVNQMELQMYGLKNPKVGLLHVDVPDIPVIPEWMSIRPH